MIQPEFVQLTGIFVQDPETKGFTAFFAQFPNIIAEGSNEEEATKNLMHTLKVVFEHQKNEELKDGCHSKDHIVTKSFNLALA